MKPPAGPDRLRQSALFILAIVAAPLGALRAQGRADSTDRIAAIVIQRDPVFIGKEGSVAGAAANFIHTTTHAPFIRAELLFKVGDRYDSARVAQSARNLRALGVFTLVAIDSMRSDSGLVMRVHTQDAWSENLVMAFRNTAGSTAWTLGLKDLNLLGTTTVADAEYHHNPDRNYVVLGLQRSRLIDGKYGVALQYIPRSDGKLSSLAVVEPWYSNEQRNALTVTAANDREQILRFRDGNTDTAFDKLAERYVLGRIDLAHAIVAAPDHYLRVGIVGQVRRDDFTEADSISGNERFANSVTAAFGGYIEEKFKDHHLVVRGYEAYRRDIDIDLSTVIRLSAFAAPALLGYDHGRSGIAPGVTLHTGFAFAGGFAFQDVVASGLYGSAGLDSGQVIASTTIALMPSVRQQLLLHAEAGALRNPVPGSEFDLGFGEGPRAFIQHAFTGDREFFVTGDYRYKLVDNFLKIVGVGVAAFGDYGGAWFAGSPRRTGWDAGVGLRLALTQDADPSINRIDLAWRGAERALPGIPARPGGWVLTFVRGVPFAFGPRGTPR